MVNIKLKLFVWENVLTDHTAGIMFAFAENVEDAKKAILEKTKEQGYNALYYKNELDNKPYRAITETEGFYIDGGA